MSNPINKAIEIKGLRTVAAACGRTYQAVQKWQRQGYLPRTEWTGETNYAHLISRVTDGEVTAESLLSLRPGAQISPKACNQPASSSPTS